MADLIWALVAFFLTLLVFSYLFGDNPLFRFVIYVFIGAAAGYAAVITCYYILLPRLVYPLLFGSFGERVLVLIPIILSVLLLAKLFPPIARAGNLPVGYLTGTAAAVIIGGAVLGTLFNQFEAAVNLFDPQRSSQQGLSLIPYLMEGAFMLLGTISTLVYFQFSVRKKRNLPAKRSLPVQILTILGQAFLAISLGAVFAGVYAASMAALIERLDFIRNTFMTLFF